MAAGMGCSTAGAAGGASAPVPLQVLVSCRDSPRCELVGDKVELVIEVRNTSGRTVELPLTYIKRTRLVVHLRDNNDPQREKHGAASMPRLNLLQDVGKLQPGESFSMDYTVDRSLVADFNTKNLSFTVTVSLLVPDAEGQLSLDYGTGKVVVRGAEPR